MVICTWAVQQQASLMEITPHHAQASTEKTGHSMSNMKMRRGKNSSWRVLPTVKKSICAILFNKFYVGINLGIIPLRNSQANTLYISSSLFPFKKEAWNGNTSCVPLSLSKSDFAVKKVVMQVFFPPAKYLIHNLYFCPFCVLQSATWSSEVWKVVFISIHSTWLTAKGYASRQLWCSAWLPGYSCSLFITKKYIMNLGMNRPIPVPSFCFSVVPVGVLTSVPAWLIYWMEIAFEGWRWPRHVRTSVEEGGP